MKIIPKENYVHLKTFDEKSKGGITIPKQYRKKLKVGEVLSVHPNEQELSVGDSVYYRGRPAALLEDETIVIPKERVLTHSIKEET